MAERTAVAAGISVIIPTRNRARRLQRAIASIRRQTRSPSEIIVVDDASQDETINLLRELAGPDLRVIHNEERRGASHARNLGIAAAQGTFLAFCDDDDLWRPEKLSLQAAALEQAPPGTGMVCCAYEVIAEPGGDLCRTWHPPDRPMDLHYFLRTTGFMTTIPLVRAACFKRVGGFDESLEGGQDRDMWIRIAEHFEVIAVPEILAEHRIHGLQITTDLQAKARASSAILRKHRALLSACPAILRRHLERAGLLHCAAGNAVAGQAFLAEALALAPDREHLRAHIEHSRSDPAGHAGELIESAFPRAGGIRLFY